MKKILLLLLLITTAACSYDTQVIESPGKNVKVEFGVNDESAFYIVYYNGQKVIDTSYIGFQFKGQPLLKTHLKIDDVMCARVNEIWQTAWGPKKTVNNHYEEMCVHLVEQNQLERKFIVKFKIYDDGVGFRFEFPSQENLDDVVIMDEQTEFHLIGNHTAWWIPADHDSYEYLYNKTRVSEIDAASYGYPQQGDRHIPIAKASNTPLTMKTDDGIYISIHEANLTDYSDMTLAVTDSLILKSELVPWADGSKVITKTPFATPWRTIQLAKSAGDLIESDLIVNLNEPNKLTDVSWIEPMKYMGIWWEMHIGKSSWGLGVSPESWSYRETSRHGATTQNALRHIDYASGYGIKGLLIEGWNTGWEYWGLDTLGFFDFVTPYPDFDIKRVVEFARSRGVEIIGHHETSGQADNYDNRLEEAFKFYNNLGIRAVKTGYAGSITPKGERHHGQYMVRHYRKVVETAAKYSIMIDAHEPIKDTGIRRTYPNMMTREGVRGMEWNAWSDGNPPEHTTIIPFTRGLAGPIDYTPGIFDLTFDKYKAKERVQSTLANQLALYVVIYSPMQMAADLPENYENHPAFEFIQKVPVDWDESIVLNGEIGDYVTVARKNGNDWYLGSITDENSRSIKLELKFLDADKNYSAKIFEDGTNADYLDNPASINIKTMNVTSADFLELNLAAGGGSAVIFELD